MIRAQGDIRLHREYNLAIESLSGGILKERFAMSDICITAAVFTTALVLSKVKRKLLDMADETRNE